MSPSPRPRLRRTSPRSDAWSRSLAAHVPLSNDGPVCGVEHEFEVSNDAGRVDARVLIPLLDAGRRRHDPIDPYARSLDDGAVITADGREAEIAIPPEPIRAGFATRATEAAARARASLESALPHDTHLNGYSTHVSVQAPDRRAPSAAKFIAERFTPLLMLALERTESPGLLVRARWNRVEVGGDFVEADLLRAALVIAVACTRHATQRSRRRGLPPKPRLTADRAIERFGWYVDRSASGSDLYAAGRSGLLHVGRTTMSVQEYVDACWLALEPHVIHDASPDDLDSARALMTGRASSGLDR